MVEVCFGRDKYHLHQDMVAWCRANIGPGGWWQGVELAGADAALWLWYVGTTFGNTEFEFKNAVDAAKFKEHWHDKV